MATQLRSGGIIGEDMVKSLRITFSATL